MYNLKYISINVLICLSLPKCDQITGLNLFGLVGVFFAGLAVIFAAGVKKEGDNFKVDYSLEIKYNLI